MSLKSVAAKIFAKRIYKKTQVWVNTPIETQKTVFLDLIKLQKKRNLERIIILHK